MTDPTDTTEPAASGEVEIDGQLLGEAHEHWVRQLQLIAPEAIGQPLAEFEEAVVAACHAVSSPDHATAEQRAQAVADSAESRPGVPRWRGAAIAVSTQYIFLGGCDVPDRGDVVEALAPKITAGLSG